MKVLNYTVKVHPAEEGGFWAEVPALPGCFTQGDTIEEVAVMAKEAIECHISGLRKVGMSVPVEKIPKKKQWRTFSIPVTVRVSQSV